MARAKPRYTGKPYPGEAIKEFSDGLKKELRGFYPDQKSVEDEVWGHPADEFVREILTATDRVVSELHHMKEDVTTEEIKSEHNDLLKSLMYSEEKLKTISLGLDRLMSIDADPRGCADRIKEMIDHLEAARFLIGKLPKSKRNEQKKSLLAEEMAIRVLEILEKYNINQTAWVNPKDKAKASKTIKILMLIGAEIGMKYDPQTWGKFIRKAKTIMAQH